MDTKKVILWTEDYLFRPNFLQRVISFSLLPLTFLYCLIVISKRAFSKPKNFDIPIISIGNLIVGGSGKTPFTIALAKRYENLAIVLRGYKRKSKGLMVVSKRGKILTDVQTSGDEAMLYAKLLKNASVIVSENREEGIKKAKELGCKIVFLDDGFSKAKIKKFDILLKSGNYKNSFCLPSGPFREPKSFEKFASLILQENIDFKREVKIKNPTQRMILITAISKPKRLDSFLPKVVEKIYFPDHYNFKKEEIVKLIQKYNASSILTTQKDAVKMEKFNLPLSILELEIKIEEKILKKCDDFIYNFGKIA